jgi:phage-related protein
MKHHLDFYFNGEFSTVKGVFNATTDTGLYEDILLTERMINTEIVKNQTKGYLLSLDRSLFSFTLLLASKDPWTRQKLDDIATWLDVNYYKEFYFLDQADRRLFVMPSGEPTFTHTGTDLGYVTVQMSSISPFSFSPKYTTTEYNISANTVGGYAIAFNNSGHFELMPIIRLRKVGVGTITIVNETDLGRIFEIRNLADGEEVYINNETKEIVSEFARTYHYDDHNGNWLKLLKGNNSLRVYGNCHLEFEYRFRYSPTL